MSQNLTNTERLREVFSMAIEDRSAGYQDLVSNANVILAIMKERGGWASFSGPTIRESLLFGESGTYTRYSGFQFLNPKPAEILNDAEFIPRMAAVSVTLSGEEILKNSGPAQIRDVMTTKIEAGEQELVDRFVEDLHGNGALANQIGGLQVALPTVNDTGVYGGISRADHSIWRTGSYNVTTDFGASVTSLDKSNVQSVFRKVTINHMRGQQYPPLIVCDQEYYDVYAQATEAIQRISKEGGQAAALGFPSLMFYGAGKAQEVVLEGGKGSAMPAKTAYFLNMDSLRFRYHEDRNFSRIGDLQTPVNQDAVVQHIGFFGNLTMRNPLFVAKLYG